LWRHPEEPLAYTTAVSLHSHTHHSEEGLDFVPRALGRVAPARALLRRLEARYRERTGAEVPYERVYWRPPLNPRSAWEVEAGQIRARLRLRPLISITDHDNLDACAELRALNVEVPYSLEWTLPYGETVFHLGVHNLPEGDARALLGAMTRCDETRLAALLAELDAMAGVLVVLNHPLSNELKSDMATHVRLLRRFLSEHGRRLHALELNGLQPAGHNWRVARMAAELKLPVVSGGDRHCLEPSANVNLTGARTFGEFVEEIRVEKRSRVLFLPQYRESIPCRWVEFLAQAVRTYPGLAGRERWLDRVFYQTGEGDVALSTWWTRGGPWMIRGFVAAVGWLASPEMRGPLRLALGAARNEVGA
jgi:hypothetical protein